MPAWVFVPARLTTTTRSRVRCTWRAPCDARWRSLSDPLHESLMFLSAAEAAEIDAHIARVEARVGVPIVAAVVGKADAYAELPWMAFALGVSLAALAIVVADWLRPDWLTAQVALLHTATILGAGAASALAAVFVPAYARLFLRPALRDLEVRHYAQSLFLRRELFKTRDRNGILMLICKFERKIEILADVGLHGRITGTDWDG